MIGRRFYYAAIGAFLSQGSPVGALILRIYSENVTVTSELRQNFGFYAYMALGTFLAFSLFGFVLGISADQLVRDRLALRHANRRLRWMSSIDSLTGVLNRRSLMERLRIEILSGEREKKPLSMVMIDLDYFKSFNDRFGHVFGDHVLRQIGRRVRRMARAGDIVGRYGGEEFAVILPNTEPAEALSFAERLRERIAEKPIVHRGRSVVVTASLGVSTLASLAHSKVEEFVEEVDTALYSAKAAGRNCVRGASIISLSIEK